MAVRRIIVAAAVAFATALSVSAQVTVAPENRCSPYSRSDYSYPQSIELRIIEENLDGKIISLYTEEMFSSRYETDIEHIVATSEAHDSGLCAQPVSTRRQFAQDLDNLTLASPSLNRHEKSSKDLAQWTPAENVCWFAQTVVNVKAKYKLSMDSREANAAIQILQRCKPREQCQSLGIAEKLNCYAGDPPANAVTAPAGDEGCFASDTARLTGAMNIRSGASIGSAKIGLALPGSFAVSGSAQGASYCWLNIGRGWIAKTSLVRAAASASQPAPQQPSAPRRACFSYNTAYVTGAMNIRSGASTVSEKVGLAQPGAYAVLESAQGEAYCWVRISNGWIAKTLRVSGAKPVSSRSSQPVSQPPAARQTSQQSTQTQQKQTQPAQQAPAAQSALALYDDNGNGRITCAEARRHGIAPVPRGHPAYQYMNDCDKDGIVCE
ncbi:MAG: excalibur calcium-binding domain-containing protein [Chloroflexi bacterium]|nr:excalibur calcium-binding domain-containing protein [Chloroflexota bacterium]